MRGRVRRVAGALVFAVASCRDTAPEREPRGAPSVAPAAASRSGASTPCVLADRWESCYVEKQLENSGLIPSLVDSAVALPMFGPPARHYRLGRGELYVVLYPDTTARAADLATLDSLTVSRRGAPLHSWPMPPYLVVSRNAAAVLLTSSEHLTVRIDDIFSAGLPLLKRR
jgi:hypothetical protein